MIPAKIRALSSQTDNPKATMNDKDVKFNLDLVETLIDRAFIRMAEYRQKMMRMYNQNVKCRSFIVGDLVIKRINISDRAEHSVQTELNRTKSKYVKNQIEPNRIISVWFDLV